MIRILVVDDHVMLRECIQALMGMQTDIEVVGEASEGKEAIEKVAELKPDVVILDISMPGMDGLEAARQIKKRNPETKILILTQHDNKEYILSAIKAGVAGYVPKRALASELISAIRAVQAGNPFLYPTAATALMADYRLQSGKEPYDRLTVREKEIFKLVIAGCTSKTISEQLNLTVKTVQAHQGRIKDKLGIHNRADLVKFAVRQGLIDINT